MQDLILQQEAYAQHCTDTRRRRLAWLQKDIPLVKKKSTNLLPGAPHPHHRAWELDRKTLSGIVPTEATCLHPPAIRCRRAWPPDLAEEPSDLYLCLPPPPPNIQKAKCQHGQTPVHCSVTILFVSEGQCCFKTYRMLIWKKNTWQR